MKKLAKLLPLTLLSLALVLSAVGCGYKFNALPDGPEASAAVENNGGAVVKKGDYLFVVNGKYDSTESNEYGAPTKGNIYRVKLKADGSIEETKLLAPKQVFSATADSGLFLSGDRIFYTSPSVEKDAKGNLMSDYLDLFSVKLNGTDTKKLGYLPSTSFTSKWMEIDGKVYFVYIDSTASAVKIIDENGNGATVVDKYVGTPVFGNDGYVYYTTSIFKDTEENMAKPEDERETESYYEVWRKPLAGGEAELLIDRTNPIVAPSGLDKGTAVTLTRAADNAVYYTKSVAGMTLTFAYDLTGKTEVKLSNSALGTVYKYLGFESDHKTYKGLIVSQKDKFRLLKMVNEEAQVINLIEGTQPTAVFDIDEASGYVYYTTGSDILRIKITDDNGNYAETHNEAEKLYASAADTTTIVPERVGDYIYFAPTATTHPVYANYLYRWLVTRTTDDTYTDDEGEEVKYQLELVGKLTEADQKSYDEAEEKK